MLNGPTPRMINERPTMRALIPDRSKKLHEN